MFWNSVLPGFVLFAAATQLEALTLDSFLDPLRDARKDSEVLIGYGYSPLRWESDKPDFNYINADFRRIWVLKDMQREETAISVIGGLFVASTVNSFGNYMAGAYIGLRYDWNFEKLPMDIYFQGLLGGLVSDAHENKSQRLMGSVFGFREDLLLGLRLTPFTDKEHYLFVEAGIQHISNAGLSERNRGVNALTINLGINLSLN